MLLTRIIEYLRCNYDFNLFLFFVIVTCVKTDLYIFGISFGYFSYFCICGVNKFSHKILRTFKSTIEKEILFEPVVKGKSLHKSQVAHQDGAYRGLSSMKRQGKFLLPPGWDSSPSQGYRQH